MIYSLLLTVLVRLSWSVPLFLSVALTYLQTQSHLFKSVPSGSVLPVPKQPLQKNDSSVCGQPNSGKSNPDPETKREMQVSSGSPLNQIQKPSHVSFISHRASISLPDSNSMSSLVHQIANSPNVKEVQVHGVISASSATKHVAIQLPHQVFSPYCSDSY